MDMTEIIKNYNEYYLSTTQQRYHRINPAISIACSEYMNRKTILVVEKF
jgi:hypothetical protein